MTIVYDLMIIPADGCYDKLWYYYRLIQNASRQLIFFEMIIKLIEQWNKMNGMFILAFFARSLRRIKLSQSVAYPWFSV